MIMSDKELFKEIFDRTTYNGRYGLTMDGTYIRYKGEIKHNIDGWSLGKNIVELSKLLEICGVLR